MTVSEAVYTYTDYQYTITYLMYCANLNSDQECLDLRKQIEIWSKNTDPIPSDVMGDLKRRAEKTLCVRASNFTDQQLGVYYSIFSKIGSDSSIFWKLEFHQIILGCSGARDPLRLNTALCWRLLLGTSSDCFSNKNSAFENESWVS